MKNEFINAWARMINESMKDPCDLDEGHYEDAKRYGYGGSENDAEEWMTTGGGRDRKELENILSKVEPEKALSIMMDIMHLMYVLPGTLRGSIDKDGNFFYKSVEDTMKEYREIEKKCPELKPWLDKVEQKWKKTGEELSRYYDSPGYKGD